VFLNNGAQTTILPFFCLCVCVCVCVCARARARALSETRVLRRIFGLKRKEVTGVWTEMLNEELHNLYSSPYIIKIIK
jgi:arginyl-tRNA--protein-N-Asp/Glu arginylyltransferase